MGEELWHMMPGQYVICDGCEKSVPQSMGALQGESHRSQFSQWEFLCCDCIQMQGVGDSIGARSAT